MKRFLSWLALLASYFAFCIILALDLFLVHYIDSLYVMLSPFLKIMVILIGGTFLLSLTIIPLWYGIPLTVSISERIYPTHTGFRYKAFGFFIVFCCICKAFSSFMLHDLYMWAYGIALIIFGIRTGKENYQRKIEQKAHELLQQHEKENSAVDSGAR